VGKVIWYVCKYVTPLKYGWASRQFYLAREFQALGHKAVVISSDSNHLGRFPRFASTYTKEDIEGIETWWIRTAKYVKTASVRRILSWLDFEVKLWFLPERRIPRPDVVIVSSLSLLTILNGIRLKARYGCTLVFEIRDIWPLTMTEEGGFSRHHPLVKLLGWVERTGYLRSDVIVGTMPNLTEHVTEVTGKVLNCQCVPMGYDPALSEHPEPLPEGYEERHLPRGKFIVGYAGSIGRTNALDTLMACAREMRHDPRFHFVVLGSGDLLEKFRAETADLPNITFAPRVRKEQVQRVLERCSVLYLSVESSRVWRFGQSLNKVIDYMTACKPIIASYDGFPSMIDEAGCGVFVPAKDLGALREAIRRYAAQSPEDLEAIGRRGKEWLLANRPYRRLAEDYCRLMGLR
jgi:glycosyltransferase involved in cell wall biosynthesis